MSACNCDSQPAASLGSKRSLRAVFEGFWPAGMPFPPRAPYLYGVLTRETMLQLLFSVGATSKIRSVRRASSPGVEGLGTVVHDQKDTIAAAGANSGSTAYADSENPCPDGFCSMSGTMSQMANDWCDEGGYALVVVELLYDLLGQEFCVSGECEDASDGTLANCRYESSSLYKALYDYLGDDGSWHSAVGWVYMWICCCTTVDEIPPWGPGPFPGPWGPFPWLPGDDDGDIPVFE
jgi:hypothetical protein